MARIQLRPAVFDDAQLMFRWRNDPFIVTLSSSQRTVQWAEHLEWFKETLSGNQRVMFIVQKDSQPIGQVRFDRLNKEVCIISVYLLKDYTGKGYGVEAIRQGCSEIFRLWAVQHIVACVRLNNLRARSGFIKASFVEANLKSFCPNGHHVLSFYRLDTHTKTEEDQRN